MYKNTVLHRISFNKVERYVNIFPLGVIASISCTYGICVTLGSLKVFIVNFQAKQLNPTSGSSLYSQRVATTGSCAALIWQIFTLDALPDHRGLVSGRALRT